MRSQGDAQRFAHQTEPIERHRNSPDESLEEASIDDIDQITAITAWRLAVARWFRWDRPHEN